MLRNKHLRRFFASYLAFTAVTVGIAAVAYGLSYSLIRHQSLTSGQRELEFARRIIEARIDDIYNTVGHLAASSELSAVMTLEQPVPSPSVYQTIRLRSILPQYTLTSAFIDGVYVLFVDSQIIVSNNYIAFFVKDFYDHFFAHEGLSASEWLSVAKRTLYRRRLLPQININDGFSERSFVRFYESIPLDSVRTRAVIMVHVREDVLMSYLSLIDVGDTGFVGIFSEDNHVIAASGNRGSIAAYAGIGAPDRVPGLLILETYSSRYRIHFVGAIPESLMFRRVSLVGYVFLLIILVEIVVGIVLGRRLAVREMLPIMQLLDVVRYADQQGESDQDEIELLSRSVSRMVRRNVALQSTLESYTPILRASFIEHLLTGGVTHWDAMDTASISVDVRFSRPLFAVCVVTVREVGSLEPGDHHFSGQPVVHAVLLDRWQEAVSFDSYSCIPEPGVTVFLCNSDRIDYAHFRSILSNAVTVIERSFDKARRIRVLVSCSELGESVSSIRGLYTQARAVHEFHRIVDQPGPLFYSDIAHRKTDVTPFDLNSEMLLSRYILAGDTGSVTRLLLELKDSVGNSFDLAPHAVQLVLDQLESAVLRILSTLSFVDTELHVDIRHRVDIVHSTSGFDERFDTLQNILCELSSIVAGISMSRHSRLIGQMQRFLMDRLSDSQLCLRMLSDEFHLSTGYTSRFFKEQAGVGMAEYLENLRISRAAELLAGDEYSVGEIAKLVGYVNPNTFYKAFRRARGVSAGEYRSQAKRDQLA